MPSTEVLQNSEHPKLGLYKPLIEYIRSRMSGSRDPNEARCGNILLCIINDEGRKAYRRSRNNIKNVLKSDNNCACLIAIITDAITEGDNEDIFCLTEKLKEHTDNIEAQLLSANAFISLASQTEERKLKVDRINKANICLRICKTLMSKDEDKKITEIINRLSEMLESIKISPATKPYKPKIKRSQIRHNIKQGKYKMAKTYALSVIKSGKADGEIWQWWFHIAVHEQNLTEAERAISELEKIERNSTGRFQQIIKELQQSIKVSDDEPSIPPNRIWDKGELATRDPATTEASRIFRK